MNNATPDRRLRCISRLVALIREAEGRTYVRPIAELAREHRCSPRTIRRDLEAIEALMPVRWRANDELADPCPGDRVP